jgi:type II secretory pathway pseudopilin PulG
VNRIKLGGREVLVELDWDPIDNTIGERRAIARLLKTERHQGKRFGAIVRGPDETAVGLVPATERVRPRQPSAAALLAKASQMHMLSGGTDSELNTTEEPAWNWLVVEKIGDDLYWMVAIHKGTPMPTTDITGSFEYIMDMTRGLQQSSDFVAHVPDAAMRGQLAINGRTSDQGFEDLLRGLEVKPSDVAVRQLAGLQMLTFVLFVVAIVVVAGILLGLHWRNARLAAEAQERARQAAAANQLAIAQAKTEYQAQVQKAVYDALDTGKKQLDQALATPAPSLLIEKWAELVSQVDMDQAGWTLVGVQCQGGKTPACQVGLSRGEGGVNRLLLDAHPDVVIDGDKASYTLVAPDVPMRQANWTRLPDARGMMVDLMSDLQLLRNAAIEYHQTPSKEVTQAVVMPKPTSDKFKPGDTSKVGPPPVVQMGVATGKLGLGSKELWQLSGLGEFLDHEGLVLQDLDVKMGPDGISGWQIDATYFLRSHPQPVLPTIVIDKDPLPLTLPKAYQEVHSASGGLGGSEGAPADLSAPAPASSAPAPQALPPPPPPPPPQVPTAAPRQTF